MRQNRLTYPRVPLKMGVGGTPPQRVGLCRGWANYIIRASTSPLPLHFFRIPLMPNAEMTSDSRSREDAPAVGGAAKPAAASGVPRAGADKLPNIYHSMRRKVMAFLDGPADDEAHRRAQGQARVSMGVIEEALRRYRWVPLPVRCWHADGGRGTGTSCAAQTKTTRLTCCMRIFQARGVITLV